MAEVLSPPIQSSGSMTMLQHRPASADAFSGSQQYHQPSRLNQAPRSMYNTQNNGYRTLSAPVQPYAFQSTPTLRQESRTISQPNLMNGRVGTHRPTASGSTTSSDSSLLMTKDDTATATRAAPTINFTPQLPELNFSSFEPAAKPSPDRYRRQPQKRVDSAASNNAARTPSPAASEARRDLGGNTVTIQQVQRQSSYDDIAMSKSNPSELAKRYRRRSLQQLDTFKDPAATSQQAVGGAESPFSAHGSGPVSSPTTMRPMSLVATDGEGQQTGASKAGSIKDSERPQEAAKSKTVSTPQKINPPPRGSSDGTKRLAAPSPLSRQASEADAPSPAIVASPMKPKTYAAALQSPAPPALSPAAQQLAAVSDRDLNKGMKSRLRRAFSFGSAQELRRAAGENSQRQQTAQETKEQHQQQIDDEMDAEQLEIARRQEAAGIGAGIYSGQGGFVGSTDNLSISSTASSASMMLRKMGRGAKKSARSIKGLFRPKSVIGVPAADGPVSTGVSAPGEAIVGAVSMVTVEAERQNVNVNAHPDERTGGGTSFPKLERNSLDAGFATAAPEARASADTSDSHSRRSIVGSDKDRAEVLAAVRKGILKRSGTSSPQGSPVVRPSDNGLPQVPHITESPSSSMPSTPKEGPFNRSASAPAVNDYFSARMNMGRSMPNTPNGSVRSISFSPRIQFHDAWSSSEYDRRGEIATCNRLTPMLAQQIKEELNTFKMEMEVHEQSKPHTHFF